MRILVLNYEYPPLGGGAAPVTRELAEFYAEQGHEVDVLTMGFRSLPAREECKGVRIIRIPALRRRLERCESHEMLYFVVRALPTVTREIRRRAYDVMHCHFIVPTGLLAYLATRFEPVPILLTAHGSDVPGHNPDRFFFEHLLTPPLLRLVLRNVSAVTAPSRYLADLIAHRVGPSGVIHIPNGIDVTRLRPREKRKWILISGRLLRMKGCQHVLEALRGMETDFEVHVAGDGPIRGELEALSAAAGARVVFHGWLDRNSPEFLDLVERAAIFCLPSERENAPVSLLESMLAGSAVIACDSAGCPEMVGDAGILVPPGDVGALRAALVQLMGSPELRAVLGERARRRVLEHYDRANTGAVYLEHLVRLGRGAERVLTARGAQS